MKIALVFISKHFQTKPFSIDFTIFVMLHYTATSTDKDLLGNGINFFRKWVSQEQKKVHLINVSKLKSIKI